MQSVISKYTNYTGVQNPLMSQVESTLISLVLSEKLF